MARSTKSSTCSRRARERIPNGTRRKVARSSYFACSICGSIPIVFHHIEEWSTHRSKDEQYLITVCDKCHRGIHGEGGNLFSKTELYKRKNNPKKPSVLLDNLPLETKGKYSFFIGSNFIADGEKASLIRFPEGRSLTTIDTSNGILKLSILAEVRNGNTIYLIKDNELMINTKDIWDMHYSRNSLKIWKIVNDKKFIFINLVLLPDVIIISEMNTAFNGKPFRIFKLRSPQKSQLAKIEHKVRSYENFYNRESTKIDNLPKLYGTHKGLDFDTIIKQTQKDLIKTRLEQDLMFDFCKKFNWDWGYYQKVLSEILARSSVFRASPSFENELPPQVKKIQEDVRGIREKYSKQFEEFKNVVVEYGGMMFNQNIMI
jgi:hypothetical protein